MSLEEARQDWYERRDELRSGMVFTTHEEAVVKLDRPVPGDGTKWFVLDLYGPSWADEGSTVEPGDLCTLLEKP